MYHWMGIHNSQVWFGCSTSEIYPSVLLEMFYRENYSIYYYVFVYLFLEKDAYVSSYESLSLGGVSLAGG